MRLLRLLCSDLTKVELQLFTLKDVSISATNLSGT